MSAETQKTILLVEDEVIIAMAEKMTLEKFGYRVLAVHHGEDAVTTVARTPGIDLILMDIDLGKGMDGTEAAALILKERDLPVVFLSSHMEPEIVAKTEKITSYGYVVKDSSGTVLDASIKMAFKLFEAKVSEMKKELALSQSNDLLTKLARLVPGVIYQYRLDPDGRSAFPYSSPGMNDIYEVTPEEVRDDATAVFARLHPDDYDKVAGAIQASALTLNTFYCEFRVLLPRQGLRWRWSQAHPERLADGGTLWHGIISDITERKLAEEALRASQRLVEEIINTISVRVFWKDMNLVYLGCNTAFARDAGYADHKDIIGKDDYQIWRDQADPYRRDDRQVIESGCAKSLIEETLTTSAGLTIHLLTSKMPLRNAKGEIVGVLGTYMDISERKLAEEALQKERDRAQHYLDIAGVILVSLAPDQTIILINKKGCELLGYSQEELMGKNWFDLILPEPEREKVKAMFARLIGGELEPLERVVNPIVIRSGEVRLISWHNALVHDAAGKIIGTLSSGEDITERKQADSQKEAALAALKESEYLLTEAQKVAHIGHWELDLKIGRPTWSEEIFHIFGLDPKKSEPSFVNHESHLHPDDWLILNMAVTKTSADGSPFDIQFRIVQPGGEIRWMQALGTATMAANGIVSKLFGTAQDITERKRAEEEVKRQLAEKEILLKEVHHRIKNNIGSIESLLSLHSQSTTNPEAISVLQDAIGRVGSMRILYDKLLLSEEYKDISVKNYLEDLIDTIIAISPSQAKITLDKQIADFHLDSKRLFPLGIIINELLTNKMKYAFIDKKAGAIKISLTHVHDHVSLSIEDNGSGLPDGFDSEQAKGFGLMLVKMLSQELGGSFSMEKHAGTRCEVEFDI